MAFFTGNIYSRSLLQDTQLNVILPQDGRFYTAKGKPKTLILLHGLSDNASVWYRKTSIERYAEQYDVTVVMPEVQRSFYHDMKFGHQALTYIAEELPQRLDAMFQTSVKREDLMIAGLSMGAYGAIRCAFENLDRFGYCGAFSGAYDMAALNQMSMNDQPVVEGFEKDVKAIFGGEAISKTSEIPYILKTAVEKGKPLPELYFTCGTEDFLYDVNQKTKKVMDDLSIDMTYEEWQGIHEWGFWDKSIERMLKLFLKE